MRASTDLRELIKMAPDLPGVYLWRGSAGDVIYVGKALSLRRRLANYLPAAMGSEGIRVGVKEREMVGRAATLEWIVTSNEVEALLLEHNLIKQHHPQYNIRLRDDKSYPYIMITMEDEWPRVMFTRQPHRKGNLYFGPYASAAKVRDTLDVLGRVFPVRTCRGKEPGRPSGSPCLQFHIDRCPAPCVGDAEKVAYRAVVDQVVDFLSGRETKVLSQLRTSMRGAAKRQDYEAAAAFRDRLEALTHVLERQQIESGSLGSADIAGLAVDDWGANVQIFITRDGKLADRRSFTLVNAEGADEEEIFERFVAEYYSTSPTVPTELIVPPAVRQTEALSAFLVSKAKYKDFQIYAEFWATTETNSGIFIRCDDPKKPGAKICYEVNIWDARKDPSYGTGAIVYYAEVNPMPKAGGRWNTYEITAKGRDITVTLNGQTTAKIRNGVHTEGPFALQYGEGVIKFRKVAIKPL